MEPNAYLQRLGEALHVRRRRLKLSQEELGARSGLHRTHVGGVERGEHNVSFLNLLALAEAMDVKLSDLLRDAGF